MLTNNSKRECEKCGKEFIKDTNKSRVCQACIEKGYVVRAAKSKTTFRLKRIFMNINKKHSLGGS